MEPFTITTGLVAPLPRSNIDTDIIIPKEFLKRIERNGFDQFLMYDWRFDNKGNKKEDFVLNREEYANSSILLTKKNFGIGSSHENAVWALKDFGFKVIIAESFADIFKINCSKNGILLVELNERVVDYLFDAESKVDGGLYLKIDLEKEIITNENSGSTIVFNINPHLKTKFLNGWNDIDMTIQSLHQIERYERERPSYLSPSI
ncbi:3-isopropylmalate dehydratase small subunit [Bacillus sp. FJAT-50079]|nr:3-isopropylmalate dehydratase small subunit [Bacillus sp. FJAT-50079]